ncbi:MAG: DUF1178 family protein [Burkholderiaceae bacterium]|jgi:hypothetical protein
MKVLDLQCAHHHAFEGWFASEHDFQSQLARGLVACPMCDDTAVTKLLSAPRLNLGASDTVKSPVAEPVAAGPSAHAEWLRMVRHVMAQSEDVGERFAEVARQMHYGETQERNIRGKATPEETEALIEEGVPVLPLLLPDALKGTLQ